MQLSSHVLFFPLVSFTGPPSIITRFIGDNTSSTTIVFMWNAPLHLPGLPPCCDYYFVNVTHFLSSDSVHVENTTNPNVTFSIAKERLCDTLLVSVTASNVVGEGDEFRRTWSLGGKREKRVREGGKRRRRRRERVN